MTNEMKNKSLKGFVPPNWLLDEPYFQDARCEALMEFYQNRDILTDNGKKGGETIGDCASPSSQ